MIDNRAKNTFIHTNGLDTEGKGGLVWDYCFNYDDDTALGCNNRGFLTLDYGCEDTDNDNGEPLQEGQIPAFNAHTSVLWNNVRNILNTRETRNTPSPLEEVYGKASAAWSSDKLEDEFKKYQAHKCARLQMIDMEQKYFRPYKRGYYGVTGKNSSEQKYLPMLQGRKTYQRQQYQTYQEIYIHSKYGSMDKTNAFSFRTATDATCNFNVTPWIKCYPSVDYDNATFRGSRTFPGETSALASYSLGGDKNFVIYPAAFLSEISGLNKLGIKGAELGNGTKLQKINVSDNTALPGDGYTFNVGAGNVLLEDLNISNTNITSLAALNMLTNLKILDTRRTKVQQLNFASGGLIETVYAGDKVTAITFENNTKLKELKLDDPSVLSTLIVNTPSASIDWTSIVDVKESPNLQYVAITDIQRNEHWTMDDNSWIEQLYQHAQKTTIVPSTGEEKFINTVILTGDIYIDSIRENDFYKYKELWPGLTISYNESGFKPTYTVTYYNDAEKTQLLLEEVYDMDVAATNPYPDRIQPTKDADPQNVYNFDSWSVEKKNGGSGFTAFNKNIDVYAIYTSTPRTYKIEWQLKVPTGNTESQYKQYTYVREDAVYQEDIVLSDDTMFTAADGTKDTLSNLTKPVGPVSAFRTCWLFSHWDKHTSYITADMTVEGEGVQGNPGPVISVWERSESIPSEIENTIEWNAATWYALLKTREQDFAQLNKEVVPCGNRAMVDFNQPQLVNAPYTDLIDKPIKFNSTDKKVVIPKDSENKEYILRADEDWTIVLEWNGTRGTPLCAHYDGYSNRGSGLHIRYDEAYKWVSTSYKSPVFTTYLYADTARKRINVISHKANSNQIIVARGNTNGYQPVINTYDAVTQIGNYTIKLGAEAIDVFGEYDQYFNGIVYGCRLYKNYFGNSMLNKLSLWYNEKISFDLTSTFVYSEDNVGLCVLNFVCSEALNIKNVYPSWTENKSSLQEERNSYINTWGLYQWLEHRLYQSFPNTWKVILENTAVPHLLQNDKYIVKQHIWLPSWNELAVNTSYGGDQVNSEFPKTKAFYSNTFAAHKFYGARTQTEDAGITQDEYLALGFVKRSDKTEEAHTGDIYMPSTYSDNNAIFAECDWSNAAYRRWIRTKTSNSLGIGYMYGTSSSIYVTSGSYYAVVPCFSIGRVNPEVE